jgi:hypothetical protein
MPGCNTLPCHCYVQVEQFDEIRNELGILAEAFQVGGWVHVRGGGTAVCGAART